MEQNTLLRFEDTVEEGAIVRAGILRNRAFSGCCNDSNRTPGWVALLSRGRINIMCRGLASSSHTPDGGSADDKAFSRPWKDKEALDSALDYLKGYAQKWDAIATWGQIRRFLSFCRATSFRDAIELLFTGRENNWSRMGVPGRRCGLTWNRINEGARNKENCIRREFF